MRQNNFTLSSIGLAALEENTKTTIEGRMKNSRFRARIAIPNYPENIWAHYADIIKTSLQQFCRHVSIPFHFTSFGLLCEFEDPTEVLMHDECMALDDDLRKIIERFGPVILRNVFMNTYDRKQGHRNRFRHLSFHRDRNPTQPTPYSLFSRDPFDSVQESPRTSSTLYCANIVAYLQDMKEEKINSPREQGILSHYELFHRENMEKVIGPIILEQPWNEPKGTGEISIHDNRTVLHASYYKNQHEKGYRIGVRYLA